MKRLICFAILALGLVAPAYAEKISALTSATTLGGTEILPCVQSSVTVGCTANQLRTFAMTYPSAALLGSATAGTNEYDGVAQYFSPQALGRSVTPSAQIATVASGAKTSLTNNITTAQSIFAAANDTFTLQANTTYRFRTHIMLNTGATSHTTAFVPTLTTATLTSIHYRSSTTSSAAATLATPQTLRVSSGSSTVLNAASTAVTTDIMIEGTFRVNAGGSMTPQIAFSAGPTGTCEVEVDSYFEVWPIGTDTVVSVGSWN